MTHLSRRNFVVASAAVGTSTIAGCLGGTDRGSPTPDGTRVQSSFFVTHDFTRHVAGEVATVENIVPSGQHGHGWEPGPDVQRSVLGSDVFVYVGEGFQPWADDVVRTVREDDADVAIIEAWADVDLIDASDGEDHDDDHEGERHEGEDDDEHAGEQHDEDDGEQHGEGDHADEHDHGTKDPHFWLDLRRAARSVETIAAGLGEVDPERADALEANAAAYVEGLEALDRTIEDSLAGRTRDAVLLAGHNSYRYLGRRYGFHVEALSGLSPDASPSPRDVRRAQDAIEEHDIEHVLAPVFESDRAARQLVAETDAREVLPLTPVPGLTEEWAEAGWGFLDVVENVNLPSLRTALGAE